MNNAASMIAVAAVAATVAGFANSARAPTSDPVIENARKAASAFADTLPKYFVKRTTTRYDSARPSCSQAELRAGAGDCQTQVIESWNTLDVVTTDVITENGKEVDTNIKINREPATQKDLESGGWAEGDFADTLQAILSPDSAAQFTKKSAPTITKRPAYRYEYSIDQPHSSWRLFAGAADYSPAYGGAIWFDRETSRVLRVEMGARNLPAYFPANKVEWTIEYNFVKIGEETYLLPTHSDTRNCDRETSFCSRNTTDFQNYRKYSSDSNITFSGGVK